MARSPSPRAGLTPPLSPSRKLPSQSWAREPADGPDKHKERIADFMRRNNPEMYDAYLKWEARPDRSPLPPHAREARREGRQAERARGKAKAIAKRAPGSKSASPRERSRSRSTTPYTARVGFNEDAEVKDYSKKDKVNPKAPSPSPLPAIDWTLMGVKNKSKSPNRSPSKSPRSSAPAQPAGQAPAAPITGEANDGAPAAVDKSKAASASPGRGSKGKGKKGDKGKGRGGKGRGGKGKGRGGRGAKGKGRWRGRGKPQWKSRRVVLTRRPGKDAGGASQNGGQS